jgi:hypothetical protein
MKWVLELLLFIAVSLLGVKLMGAVITQRDAEVWLRQPDGSQLHLKGVDVAHPFFGGLLSFAFKSGSWPLLVKQPMSRSLAGFHHEEERRSILRKRPIRTPASPKVAKNPH